MFNSGTTYSSSVTNLDDNHFAIAYGNQSIIGTQSGYNLSFGASYSYSGSSINYAKAAGLDDTHFVIAYYDPDNSDYGTAVLGTVSGTTITYGSNFIFNSASTKNQNVVNLDSSHFVVAYQDEGNSHYGTAIKGTLGETPGTPSNPSPADLAVDVLVDADLSWTNGDNTDTIDLYFDTVNPPVTKVIDNTLATSYDPGTMVNSTTYYWQVVCKNDFGDTEGSVWSFTTEAPTAITLSSFTATYAADQLAICWSTQSESNNAGWNIYRSETELEEAIQINGTLIEGAGTTSEPTDYIFYDIYPVEYGNSYNYWLESRDYAGNTETYGPVSLTVPQPGDDPNDPDNAEFFGLYQNIPNPLDNTTTIRFNLKEAANCKLVIYNTKGQTVKTFTANNTDDGEFVWDRKDTKGNQVASGLYFYRLDAGDDFFIKKMVVSQ